MAMMTDHFRAAAGCGMIEQQRANLVWSGASVGYGIPN
jgi:hypothetical protein